MSKLNGRKYSSLKLKHGGILANGFGTLTDSLIAGTPKNNLFYTLTRVEEGVLLQFQRMGVNGTVVPGSTPQDVLIESGNIVGGCLLPENTEAELKVTVISRPTDTQREGPQAVAAAAVPGNQVPLKPT